MNSAGDNNREMIFRNFFNKKEPQKKEYPLWCCRCASNIDASQDEIFKHPFLTFVLCKSCSKNCTAEKYNRDLCRICVQRRKSSSCTKCNVTACQECLRHNFGIYSVCKPWICFICAENPTFFKMRAIYEKAKLNNKKSTSQSSGEKFQSLKAAKVTPVLNASNLWVRSSSFGQNINHFEDVQTLANSIPKTPNNTDYVNLKAFMFNICEDAIHIALESMENFQQLKEHAADLTAENAKEMLTNHNQSFRDTRYKYKRLHDSFLEKHAEWGKMFRMLSANDSQNTAQYSSHNVTNDSQNPAQDSSRNVSATATHGANSTCDLGTVENNSDIEETQPPTIKTNKNISLSLKKTGHDKFTEDELFDKHSFDMKVTKTATRDPLKKAAAELYLEALSQALEVSDGNLSDTTVDSNKTLSITSADRTGFLEIYQNIKQESGSQTTVPTTLQVPEEIAGDGVILPRIEIDNGSMQFASEDISAKATTLRAEKDVTPLVLEPSQNALLHMPEDIAADTTGKESDGGALLHEDIGGDDSTLPREQLDKPEVNDTSVTKLPSYGRSNGDDTLLFPEEDGIDWTSIQQLESFHCNEVITVDSDATVVVETTVEIFPYSPRNLRSQDADSIDVLDKISSFLKDIEAFNINVNTLQSPTLQDSEEKSPRLCIDENTSESFIFNLSDPGQAYIDEESTENLTSLSDDVIPTSQEELPLFRNITSMETQEASNIHDSEAPAGDMPPPVENVADNVKDMNKPQPISEEQYPAVIIDNQKTLININLTEDSQNEESRSKDPTQTDFDNKKDIKIDDESFHLSLKESVSIALKDFLTKVERQNKVEGLQKNDDLSQGNEQNLAGLDCEEIPQDHDENGPDLGVNCDGVAEGTDLIAADDSIVNLDTTGDTLEDPAGELDDFVIKISYGPTINEDGLTHGNDESLCLEDSKKAAGIKSEVETGVVVQNETETDGLKPKSDDDEKKSIIDSDMSISSEDDNDIELLRQLDDISDSSNYSDLSSISGRCTPIELQEPPERPRKRKEIKPPGMVVNIPPVVNFDSNDDVDVLEQALLEKFGLWPCNVALVDINAKSCGTELNEIERLTNLDNIKRQKKPSTSSNSPATKRKKKGKKMCPKSAAYVSNSFSDSSDQSDHGDTENMPNTSRNVSPLPEEDTHNEIKIIEDENELAMEFLNYTVHDITSSDKDSDSDHSERILKRKRTKLKNVDADEETSAKKRKVKSAQQEDLRKQWKNDPLLKERFACSDTDSESDKPKEKRKSKKTKTPEPKSGEETDDGLKSDTPEAKQEILSGNSVSLLKSVSIYVDSSDSDVEFIKMTKHKKKQESPSKPSNSDDDLSLTPRKKGRKNIRAIISDEMVGDETRKAELAEKKRKERISQRYKTMEATLSQSQLVEEDGLILDFDNEADKPLITVHPLLTERLKRHQQDGVRFMWDCCYESVKQLKTDTGSGCILAHCMGLGKTFQVVALIHTLFQHPVTNTNHVLVICPLSIVLNWVNEFKILERVKNGRKIDVFSISEKQKLPAQRVKEVEKWNSKSGVLIMGYEAFLRIAKVNVKAGTEITDADREIQKILVNPGPDLVVIDEGHLLKNGTNNRTRGLTKLNSKRRIVLTGTPLQNNLTEYYHMVQFVKPNLLGSYQEYLNRFANPIMNGQYDDSTDEDIVRMKQRSHVLHKLLKGTIQRFEVSELQAYLPPKIDYALFVQLHPVQASLYKRYLERIWGIGDEGVVKGKLFTDFHQLQAICTHPYLLYLKEERNKNSKKDKKEIETIDLDPPIAKETEDVPPGWFEDICPKDFKTNLSYGPKFEVMFSIIKECLRVGDKILIFSNSLVELDAIEHFFQLNEVTKGWKPKQDYFRMDGFVVPDARTRLCDEFNSPSCSASVFLMSHKVGGLGLNLIAANRVILMDVNWNPAYDSQSIFRTYRFGQEKPCFVYRLTTMGTMEEVIYERSVTKLAIAGRVVDEMQITRHYKSHDLVKMYRFNINLDEERPTPILPSDEVLAHILQNHTKAVFKYHEHHSLLENLPDEVLNEDERKCAWEEFNRENEKEKLQEEARKRMALAAATAGPSGIQRIQSFPANQTAAVPTMTDTGEIMYVNPAATLLSSTSKGAPNHPANLNRFNMSVQPRFIPNKPLNETIRALVNQKHRQSLYENSNSAAGRLWYAHMQGKQTVAQQTGNSINVNDRPPFDGIPKVITMQMPQIVSVTGSARVPENEGVYPLALTKSSPVVPLNLTKSATTTTTPGASNEKNTQSTSILAQKTPNDSLIPVNIPTPPAAPTSSTSKTNESAGVKIQASGKTYFVVPPKLPITSTALPASVSKISQSADAQIRAAEKTYSIVPLTDPKYTPRPTSTRNIQQSAAIPAPARIEHNYSGVPPHFVKSTTASKPTNAKPIQTPTDHRNISGQNVQSVARPRLLPPYNYSRVPPKFPKSTTASKSTNTKPIQTPADPRKIIGKNIQSLARPGLLPPNNYGRVPPALPISINFPKPSNTENIPTAAMPKQLAVQNVQSRGIPVPLPQNNSCGVPPHHQKASLAPNISRIQNVQPPIILNDLNAKNTILTIIPKQIIEKRQSGVSLNASREKFIQSLGSLNPISAKTVTPSVPNVLRTINLDNEELLEDLSKNSSITVSTIGEEKSTNDFMPKPLPQQASKTSAAKENHVQSGIIIEID